MAKKLTKSVTKKIKDKNTTGTGLKAAEKSVGTYTRSLEKDKMTYEKQANNWLGKIAKDKWNAKNNANYRAAQNYINQYSTRPDFSYDVNSDALYKQYRDIYTRNAEAAMRNTVAQQNAANGGYSTSYGQVAAQQQYQNNINDLNNVVPTLYEAAYNKYQDKGQQMLNSANAYQGMYGLDKEAYDTNLARKQYVQGTYENRKTTTDNAYGAQVNADRDYAFGKKTDARDFNYTKAQNAKALAAAASSGGGGGRSSGGGGSYSGGGSAKTYTPTGKSPKKGTFEMTVLTTKQGGSTYNLYTNGKNYYIKSGSDYKKVDADVASNAQIQYKSGVDKVLSNLNYKMRSNKGAYTDRDIDNAISNEEKALGIELGVDARNRVKTAFRNGTKVKWTNGGAKKSGSKAKAAAKKKATSKSKAKATAKYFAKDKLNNTIKSKKK